MPTLAEILAAKKAGPSTVIRRADEKDKLASSIKQTLDASAPKPLPPLPMDTHRELGAVEKGERIPMDHPAPGSEDEAWHWFDSIHSFDTDMGIVVEPDGAHAWIAVQAKKHEPPLLLFRLPLLNRKIKANPF